MTPSEPTPQQKLNPEKEELLVETFFTQPRELAAVHPALYEILRDYYRQDPAARKGPT